MSDNSYAPPQADLGDGLPALSEGAGDFDFGRAFSDAWANTWANFPLWLVAGVVWTLVTLLAIVTVIGAFLAFPVLLWGAFVFFLKMHDGGAQLADLFSGFSRYGSVLAVMLGFYLITFVVGIAPLMAAQATNSGAALRIVGYAIYIGVALLVTPRLWMVPFLMIDRGIGLGEALRLAWDRTGPLMWKLAGLLLLAIPILFLGTLALLIGVIPATVITYLMWVSAYRQIFGGAPRAGL
jgi:hypothetical protein